LTTVINDKRASHRNSFNSFHLPRIHQKQSVASYFAWPMDYHDWGSMLEANHKLHPKPKSITKLKEVLQVIWDSLPQQWINKTV